ncbi:transcription repressor OFP17 [Durio zibethinus]|uniref:Transcription repressor OFP17 n=1 Tax=Durio zibethinus TaxID=66656 RepID=A0A6P5XV68_DURZI|nr:transcription repressor OFP17 [Durio zibethinus]
MKALIAFRSKLFNPCRKLLRIFRFKLKRPVFIRALRTRPRQAKVSKAPKKSPTSALLSVFRSLRKSRKMDKLVELRSFSEAGHDRLLFPSPLTPSYTRVGGSSKRESSGYDDVEDACRSFENYLVEMIVDEGKVSDLMDVEELLYCWKNLTCPVFIDLVSRFYGELCTDLFSADDDADNVDSP